MAASEEKRASRRLLQVIKSRAGVNLTECYQCQKCSNGCAIAEVTDVLPHALIKRIHFGQEKAVLYSRHIWLCVSCEACTTRCPNEVDFCSVVDVLRHIALEQGIEPAEPDVKTFHETVLENLARHGRMFELGMIARLKLRTGNYFKDAGMGLGMIRRGKIRLRASNVRDKQEVGAMFERGNRKG